MSEQLGSFLPAEEDQIERYQTPKEQKIPALSSAEKEILLRLEKSSKQRELDINVFAPALDNIETLLLPEKQRRNIWAEIDLKDIEREKNNIVTNIRVALARELVLVENAVMSIEEKQGLIRKLEALNAEMKNKHFDNFLSQTDLKFLKQKFSSRFEELFKQQNRQAELGVRSLAHYRDQNQIN
ncbi:MAG: hypothetical protein NTX82_04870 [Candidatus Parcubacteria bacterium]|nr:hypothetical protein [Candidatus Parcubacteria bacterium]